MKIPSKNLLAGGLEGGSSRTVSPGPPGRVALRNGPAGNLPVLGHQQKEKVRRDELQFSSKNPPGVQAKG